MANFEGCSPGTWGTNLNLWEPTNYSPDDIIDEVFGVTIFGDLTLVDALPPAINLPTPPDPPNINALTTKAVAALLNAAHPNVNYPLSEEQVISLYQTAIDETNIQEQTEQFESFNELFCPLVNDINENA